MRLRKSSHFAWILLIIVLGVGVSVSVFIGFRSFEQLKIQNDFKDDADGLYAALQMEIRRSIDAMESLKALYVANKYVSRSEFQAFTSYLLARHSGIQALEWLPRIADSQRIAFENRAKQDGFPAFRITEGIPQRHVVRAGRRNEYFPVQFLAPYEGNELLLGFDLASEPVRRALLDSARDKGKTVATEPIELVQGKRGRYGCLVFTPVYGKAVTPNTIEERRKYLRGFVVGVFRIRDLMENALANLPPASIYYAIYDVSAPRGKQFLYFHPSRASNPDMTQSAIDGELVKGFLHTKTMDFAGHKWNVVFTPASEYPVLKRSWQPFAILFLGFLMTALLAGFFVNNARHLSRLSRVNRRLSDEVEERKKAQNALKTSEELYRTFIDTSTDMVFLADEQRRYLIANKAYLDYFGKKQEQVTGKTLLEVHPPRLARRFDESDRELLELNHLVATETMLGERIMEIRKFPVRLGENRTGIGGVMRDITKRRHAEKRIQESEERYHSIFENAIEGIYQIAVDGRFISVNPAMARIHGFQSPEEMVTKVSNMASQLYVHHEDLIRYVTLLKKEGRVEGFEAEFFRKDGTRIWTSLNTRAARDFAGNLLYYEGTVEDITERKRAQEALRDSEERYRVAIEHSNDGVIVVQAGNAVYVNNKFLNIHGYSQADEVVGKSIAMLIHPDDRERVMDYNTRRQQEQDAPSHYEFRGITKDGKTIYLEVSATHSLYWGRPAVFVFVRDITDRKRAEQEREEAFAKMSEMQAQLVQIEKMAAVGQLASGVAHEIKNPLAIILQGMEYLESFLASDPSLKEVGGMVKSATVRADKIVKDLLGFSRKSQMVFEEADIAAVLEESLSLVEHQMGLQNIKVVRDFASDVCKVFIDKNEMRQVFINIMVNAIEAMKLKGGTLTIVVADGDHKMRITFFDTGSGIGKKELEKIFDPFYTTKEGSKNTGLGLSICHKIVEAHRGSIKVESRLGKGTAVTIELQALK